MLQLSFVPIVTTLLNLEKNITLYNTNLSVQCRFRSEKYRTPCTELFEQNSTISAQAAYAIQQTNLNH